MPEKSSVSIITVCYNEKNIENTCKSIVSQSFNDYEWIVVDGGSTDGTVDILNEYKSHMALLVSEKDKGIYDGMNKGIKVAKGKWVIFMNGGDCFYEKDSLKKIFSHGYNEDIIFADGINNVYNTKHPLPINKKGKIILYKFFTDSSLCHQATFIKRELFDKIGLYDLSYKIIADHCFNYIAIRYFNVKYRYVPEVVALIDITGASMKNRRELNNELEKLKREKANLGTKIITMVYKYILKIREKI